jgi:nitrite reductase/ring-hydroxylating ferredoxin subunit
MPLSQPIAKVGEIPEGQGRRFLVGTLGLAVFQTNGCHYAIQHSCPHMGTGLAQGRIENGAVVCPRHQWRWRLSDGKFLEADEPALTARTYPIKIVGEEIHIVLSEGQGTEACPNTSTS